MRKLVIVVVAVVLAAGLYTFVAAPRIALAAIERAAAADDVTALAYHLDLESVRAQLRADFDAAVPAAALPTDDPLERLGAAFGTAVGAAFGALVGTTVAELVASPEGILQLLGGVPLRPLLGGAPGVRNTVAATFDRSSTRYEALDAFVLSVPSAGAEDASTEFVLRPRGLVWKVAEVRLPVAP
ncbi:MAG: DUF2939 domain-containing protein [Trueperaceae bacterium]